MVIRIGTRGSPLALKQTDLFINELVKQNLLSKEECHVIPIKTTGDMVQDRPLAEIGGKALFAKEIEAALISGEIDCAVHSLKDMETHLPLPLEIAAVLSRESPWDVWISRDHTSFEEIAPGAVVGSCSPRRKAQLLSYRPDLQVKSIRGNVQTRLKKLEEGEYDALILADAGLTRLGLRDKIIERFPLTLMVPAAGQGVIGIECRKEDSRIKSLLAKVNHLETYYRVQAERALVQALGGTCRTPIGAFASLIDEGMLRLHGILAADDAQTLARYKASGKDPIELGKQVAKALQTQLSNLCENFG